MNFLWPDALWLLIVLPALAGAYLALLRRRNTEFLRYAAVSFVREALVASHWVRRHLPPLLFLLGLAALLLAVARPAAITTVRSEQGTIILAMDVSFSMAATDVAPTRLAAAQAAAANFVNAQPRNVRIGIVAFGGHAHVAQFPTLSRRDVLAALDRLELQPYTAIGTGLIAALLTIHPMAGMDGGNDIFSHGWEPTKPEGLWMGPFQPIEKSRKRVATPADLSTAIILVSDGAGSMGVPPVKAAEAAAERGIRVYTVGVGTPYGGTAHVAGWPPMHAEFHEEMLREIAHVTRGEYFHARNAGKLNRIYSQLTGRAILERRKTEMTLVLSTIGLILSLTAAGFSLLWFHRYST